MQWVTLDEIRRMGQAGEATYRTALFAAQAELREHDSKPPTEDELMGWIDKRARIVERIAALEYLTERRADIVCVLSKRWQDTYSQDRGGFNAVMARLWQGEFVEPRLLNALRLQ